MISIFIMIVAYRYYANLAERFGKTKWHFGLLALGIYLGFQVFFLFAYGIYEALTNPNFVDENNYTGISGLNFVSWIIAVAAVYGGYKILENRLQKEDLKKPAYEIDQIGQKENR
ncbi:hypothetical protein ASG01_07305 [Chryseobacterium sp. Leaf180]|uniref:hypothetical protein n=1 Tax=Chryseobacterium sp. Leaf180 TaxID=1736289 RepID=UPI0006F75FD4|nr:hypothetical protein [Chryseobacterium sp. Leaf180]KQR93677.1 hypothetical protein ASG01_07305 [Chryseobacterium sp. Leaf180]